jgi:hypothetical protein
VPTVPAGKLAVVIDTGAGLTTMLRLAVEVSGVLSESLTPTVKLEVPAAVGVPEITPVLAFSANPAGKLPVLMLHVYGATPPLAANVCE